MSALGSSELGLESSPERARPAQALALPVAIVMALLIVIGGLAEGAWPTARLWVICGVLAGGLLVAVVSRVAGARQATWSVQAAAALALVGAQRTVRPEQRCRQRSAAT